MKRLEMHKKTRLCKFFAAGSCTRGNSCASAHGSCQLRDKPNLSKTRLCADFLEHGRCMRGEACSFAVKPAPSHTASRSFVFGLTWQPSRVDQ